MMRLLAITVLLIGCSSRPPAPVPAPAPDSPGTGDVPSGGGSPPTDGADAGMPEQSPSAILLDPSATAIRAVSPDAKRVLVSATRDPYLQGLSLVTRGEPTKVLVADGTYAVGFFTSDGKAIVFTAGNTGEARGPALQLARADGNGVQLLAARNSFYLAAGRWLYYTDESDTGFTLNRLMPPDGAPEVLATHSGAYNVYGAVHAISSPDGESIAYCRDSVPLDCHLRAVGSPSSVDLPDSPMRWAPDGSFLLTWACNMVDISGAARQLCDAPPSLISLSPDGSWIATRTTSGYHLIATSSGEDRLLPAPGPVDMNVFRPRSEIGFTPDSSRVIAILSHASFSIPTAGGSWTEISSDHGARGMSESDWPDVSPDSRIIAD